MQMQSGQSPLKGPRLRCPSRLVEGGITVNELQPRDQGHNKGSFRMVQQISESSFNLPCLPLSPMAYSLFLKNIDNASTNR